MNENAQDSLSSCNELSNDALPQVLVKENTEKSIRLSYIAMEWSVLRGLVQLL